MAQDFYKKDGNYFLTSGQKILNPQELQGFAKAGGREIQAPSVPAGMVAIPGAQYNTAEKQKSAFSNIQPIGGTLYGVPIQTSLTTDQMGAGSNIPPATQANDINAMMAGIKTGNEAIEAQLKLVNSQLASQEKKDAITTRMDTEAEAQRTAQRDTQEQMWERFGLGQNVEQLQAIMPQIAKAQAEFDNFSIAQEGRVASASSIYGRQALIQRQKAVELAGLSAVAQAYQGNVEMARTLANDAINAQYTDQQNYMENLKLQLGSIKEDLSMEDKARATSLELVINEREKEIQEEKYQATNKTNLMITLAEMGVSQAEIRKVMDAKTYDEAIMAAIPHLKNRLSINEQMLLMESGYKLDDKGNLYVNPGTDPITGAETDPSMVIGGYNFTSYAIDPKTGKSNLSWAVAVKENINNMGELNSIADLDKYIKSKNSTIANANKNNTSQNAIAIWNSAQERGIPVELLAAISQHESYFGTSNVAKNNNNPGGITWNKNFPESMKGTARPTNEGGHYVKFPTLQDGFEAVAGNISRRYQGVNVETAIEEVSQEARNWAEIVKRGEATLANVPTDIRTQVASALAELPGFDEQKAARLRQTTIRSGGVVLDVRRALDGIEANKNKWFKDERKYQATLTRDDGRSSYWAQKSPYFAIEQHIQSVKSNISIDQLQQMREASPTGGALGQVPVQQQRFLMEILGSLDILLNDKDLKQNLNYVMEYYAGAVYGYDFELEQAVVEGRMTEEERLRAIEERDLFISDPMGTTMPQSKLDIGQKNFNTSNEFTSSSGNTYIIN